MKQRSLITIAFLSMSLVLMSAACGGPNESQSTATTDTLAGTDTASATHPGSPGGTALVPEVEAGTTVMVVLEDNSIGVQGQTIPPGPAVLTVTNRGSDVHNLFVEGPGVSRAAGDAIPEGQSATVEVTFQQGTYTLYCPIADHRQNGEETKITINSPTPAPGATGTTTGGTTTGGTTTGGTTAGTTGGAGATGT